jgi:hypothetical protein
MCGASILRVDWFQQGLTRPAYSSSRSAVSHASRPLWLVKLAQSTNDALVGTFEPLGSRHMQVKVSVSCNGVEFSIFFKPLSS